jgi:hypothetical protein
LTKFWLSPLAFDIPFSMKICLFSPLAASLALIFASVTGRTIAADSTSPGTYTDWNGRIDHLTIVQPFKTAAFKKLVVKPVSTENVDLPDEVKALTGR